MTNTTIGQAEEPQEVLERENAMMANAPAWNRAQEQAEETAANEGQRLAETPEGFEYRAPETSVPSTEDEEM
jgi:hypothetical protein